jgi:hypothetical protein
MRAINCVFAGLLFILPALPVEAETLNVLECTFKDGANKPDNATFMEQIAWHQTLDFPKGISGPVLFQKTGEMGEPQGDIGLVYSEVRHDELGIVAAVDLKEMGDPKFGGAKYFDYDRKTGAAQLISVTGPTVPAQIETGTCTQQSK